MTTRRDPRAEATAVLPDGFEARVLEPSPPASTVAPHLADDPTDPDGATSPVVSPVTGLGDRTWADVVAEQPELAGFAAERWLVPDRGLGPLPDAFPSTRDALHRLALHVVYRARRDVNGKYGLRWTLGGFGTPFFGDDVQVRVEAGGLVRQAGDEVSVAPITSLAAAAEHVGVALDPEFDHGMNDVVDAGDVDADLGVDPAAVVALGEWYGFVTAVLEQVRADERAASPSRTQLWPEHFDVAVDLAWGAGDGQRVNLGGSPGDGFHAEPYLYVGPWGPQRPGSDDGYWSAPFGAVLGLTDLLAAGDGAAQRARAATFLHDGLRRLRAG